MLADRQVERSQVRSDEIAAAGVAERPEAAARRRSDRTTVSAVPSTAPSAPGRARSSDDPGRCRDRATGSTATAIDSPARTPSADCRSSSSRSRDLPAPEHRAGRTGRVASERQLPGEVRHPVVPRGSRTGPCCSPGMNSGRPRSCRWSRRRRTSTPASCRRVRERVRGLHREAVLQRRRTSKISALYQESPSLLFSSMVENAVLMRGAPAGKNSRPSAPCGRRAIFNPLRSRCLPRDPA